MGPRSDERGNDILKTYNNAGALVASMGPRSDERGNVQEEAVRIVKETLALQWGRAPMSAEISL